MLSFIGDYTCKLDSKWRIVVPAVFRKEMQAAQVGSFVLRRNIFESCIDVYPKSEWLKLVEELRMKLSPFNQEHMRFRRGFFQGTLEVEMDANGRILIPRKMLDEVGIGKEDVVLVGLDSRIEIWDKIKYEGRAMSTEEFVLLTDKLNVGNLGL